MQQVPQFKAGVGNGEANVFALRDLDGVVPSVWICVTMFVAIEDCPRGIFFRPRPLVFTILPVFDCRAHNG